MIRIKLARFLPFFVILMFAIVLFIGNILDRKGKIYLPLDKYSDTTNILKETTLERFRNIEVRSEVNKEVVISNPGIIINFLAPDPIRFMDNLRILFVIIGGVIFIITFWNFSYQRPFTKDTTLGMRLMTITLFVYISAVIMRNYWLTNYLYQQTGHNFRLESPNIIFSAEFLLAALFLRITRVFKKGTTLQREHDLTV